MPYIQLRDPWGMCYTITARGEAVLSAWFDEILPIVNRYMRETGNRGLDISPAKIVVQPILDAEGKNPDWITDSRVFGRIEEFPARDAQEGLEELARLRERLEKETAMIQNRQTRDLL